ncbi:MAG TPA: hypothetical protein V6C58_04125 [Allocoleopsis sp.]
MRVKKTKTSWRHLVEMASYGKQCCLDKMKSAKTKREYMYWRCKFEEIHEAEITAWFIIDNFEKL